MALVVIDTTEAEKLARTWWETTGPDLWDTFTPETRRYITLRWDRFLAALRADTGDLDEFAAAVDARIAAAIDAKLGVEKGLRRLLTEPRQCGATSYTGRCCTLTGCHGNHETWVDGTLIHTWNDAITPQHWVGEGGGDTPTTGGPA